MGNTYFLCPFYLKQDIPHQLRFFLSLVFFYFQVIPPPHIYSTNEFLQFLGKLWHPFFPTPQAQVQKNTISIFRCYFLCGTLCFVLTLHIFLKPNLEIQWMLYLWHLPKNDLIPRSKKGFSVSFALHQPAESSDIH